MSVFVPFAMSSSSSSTTRYHSGGHRSSSSSSGGGGASGRLASSLSRDYGGPDFERANSHHSSPSPRNGSLHRHQVRGSAFAEYFPLLRDSYFYCCPLRFQQIIRRRGSTRKSADSCSPSREQIPSRRTMEAVPGTEEAAAVAVARKARESNGTAAAVEGGNRIERTRSWTGQRRRRPWRRQDSRRRERRSLLPSSTLT